MLAGFDGHYSTRDLFKNKCNPEFSVTQTKGCEGIELGRAIRLRTAGYSICQKYVPFG